MEIVIDSCVRGHHILKEFWLPIIAEELSEQEEGNPHDPYAVTLLKGITVVGHVPRKISAACSLFLQRQGTILCTITGNRRFSEDLLQGGLEVPCELRFRGEVKLVEKMKKLLMPRPAAESDVSAVAHDDQ